MNKTPWRIPVSDGQVEGEGSRDSGQPDRDDGKESDPEGGPVIGDPVAVEVDKVSFLSSQFQASGAEMPVSEIDVAQGAEKPSAVTARNDGLLLGMVEATCLVLGQALSGFSGPETSEEGRKEIDPDRRTAGGTRDEVRLIRVFRRDRCMAPGTGDVFHISWLRVGLGILSAPGFQLLPPSGQALMTLVSQMRSCRARFS
jgi:hypothetical protein